MLLIQNIRAIHGIREDGKTRLSGGELGQERTMENAWLLVRGGTIEDFGSMDKLPTVTTEREVLDAEKGMILPGFCDSHTHLVFAEDRDQEFEDRILGLSYEEVAQRGGGILNSVTRLRELSEDELFERSLVRAKAAIMKGTTLMEIKSGYGLDFENERKMLRVAKRLEEELPIRIKTTLLAAHAFPKEFAEDKEGYVQHIIDRIIPDICEEGLADYIDAFCERGYFSAAQTDRILEAGVAHGLKPKVHVNQFSSCAGIQISLKHRAVSVDHLEVMHGTDLEDLLETDTIATALPACSFFLGIPYTPARDIIDGGGTIALATDFNPGSSPTHDMRFVWSLACLKMDMTPTEALHALTLNGAAAMEMSDHFGSITIGKQADLILTKPMERLASIPYRFTEDPIKHVFVGGSVVDF